MDARIKPDTVVHLLYRDGWMTTKTGMDDPGLWKHDGSSEDILVFQIEGSRNQDYWDRLTQHVETFNLVMPHPDTEDMDEYKNGWSDARVTIYSEIRMQFFQAWVDAFQEMEKSS